MGAGSLALLAFQSDRCDDRLIRSGARARRAYSGFGSERLTQLVEETRRLGYAFNDQMIVPGMSAIGVPVLGKDGIAVAALSVAAITSRSAKGRFPCSDAEPRSRRLEEHLSRILGPVTAEGLLAFGRRRAVGPTAA